MSDQCALDKSGSLKEAKDVEFFYSESETTPLPSSGAAASLQQHSHESSHDAAMSQGFDVVKRKKNVEKLYASIAAEQRDESVGPVNKARNRADQPRKPKIVATTIDNESDPDDGNFVSDGSSTEGSGGGDTEVDDLEAQPSNAEIADILPSKSMPTTGRGSGKRKRSKTTVRDVEDEDSPQNLRARSPVAARGSITEDNDSYRTPKVSCSPPMFHLYSILKSRRPEGHITEEEINITSGKRLLTAEASAEFLGGLEAQSENIKNPFAKQQEQAMVCLYTSPTALDD
ncbi:hypothetical protein EDB84DRAFT_1678365 [Lactarius hengduanensis]|nr:hypothetical protein EDB84DRAFT_1678365 [Lactarius hengduanensis]